MQKILCLFLVFVILSPLSGQDIQYLHHESAIDVPQVKVVVIELSQLVDIAINTHDKNFFKVISDHQGEYAMSVQLGYEVKEDSLLIKELQLPSLQLPDDKLSANKSPGYELQLTLPQDCLLIVDLLRAHSAVQGKYRELIVNQRSGSTHLSQLEAPLQVIGQDLDVFLTSDRHFLLQEGASHHAQTATYPARIDSKSGRIHVVE